jgi:hypothetical protein
VGAVVDNRSEAQRRLSCTLSNAWTRFSFRFIAGQSAAASFNLDLGVQPGTYFCDDIALVKLESGTGAVDDDERISPREFFLGQNYPNPFNPSTTIRYGLPSRAHVSLAVFNTLGQQVSVLQNGEQEAGYHEVKFDGANLPSGIYLYRLQAGSFTETKKVILVR